MEALQAGRIYEGTVEGYGSEGQGVLRVAGAVVFVPYTVRGERVRFRVTKVMKSAAAGEVVDILNPSLRRREPECPHFGTCGGCAFWHVSREEELWAKRQRVQDALARLGGVDIDVEMVSVDDSRRGYRNKAQFPVDAAGHIGFYQARSHRVVPVEDCPIQAPAANRTAAAVRRWMVCCGVSGYEERSGRGLVRHVYVRTNRAGESLCCVVANARTLPHAPELVGMVRDAAPETVGVLLNSNTRPGNVVLGDRFRTLWGRAYLDDTLCGLTFRLSAPSFYQVNPPQAERLYGIALDCAGLTGTETALDLYCGAGTITLCLARKARRVIGAEIVPEAVRDAAENAARNGIANASFSHADAGEIAARLKAEGLRPDVVTVDPPRKGLAPEVIAAVAGMGPPRVVYVSCDPGTLGRDAARFRERGYTVTRAAAVDMFPATKHVESVVLLSQL